VDRVGEVLALPVWEWFHDADSVSEYLVGLAERLEQGLTKVYPKWMADRARVLACRTLAFDRNYFLSLEGHVLGYFIIFKDYDIIVKALVARGRSRPVLSTINVEKWLERCKRGDTQENTRRLR
jgi:hypothetical protein